MFELIRFWSTRGKAARLARSLHTAATDWAEHFALFSKVENPVLQQELLRETLAFSLTLLQERLKAERRVSGAFVQAVRQECSRRHEQRFTRSDPAPNAAAPGSEFNRHFAVIAANPSGHSFELTEEMFREFCEFTGLGSTTLVGDGANLASLIFYMVVHGRIFSSNTVPFEQRMRLMRSVRECRQALEQTIHRNLGPDPIEDKDLSRTEATQAALPQTHPPRQIE